MVAVRDRTERVYRAFGLVLVSGFELRSWLRHGGSVTPDITIGRTRRPLALDVFDPRRAVYVSPYRGDDGRPLLSLYKLAWREIVNVTGVASYEVASDCILCYVRDVACDRVAEYHLLTTVLAFWFERRGIPPLHSSAVVVDNQQVAFLASTGGGKTALAGTLVQSGCPLVTDDILPVECRNGVFVGRPSYPQMRMWPDEAKYFLGRVAGLERVEPRCGKRWVPVGPTAFGEFLDRSLPLACLYLAERRDSDSEANGSVQIVNVSARDALVELVRHSYTPRMAEAAGLAPSRLDFFSQMVKQVPVRRIVYTSGFEHLPLVRDAILKDLSELP